MLALRSAQIDLLEQARACMRAGQRRVLVQASTGFGKTVLASHMLANAVAKGNRAWFVVHRRELLTQSARAFAESADLDVGLIAAGFPSNPAAPIQVCSVQTLTKRLSGLQVPDFLVMDECFVAGTMIGDTPIERLCVGDVVPTWNEDTRRLDYRVVLSMRKSSAPSSLFAVTSAGATVYCTASHPFLTWNRGWRTASELQNGDLLHGMLSMWSPSRQSEKSEPAVHVVLPARDGRTKQKGCAEEDEGSEPDEDGWRQGEGFGHAQENRPQAERSRRQRLRDACASCAHRIGAWLAYRGRSPCPWRASPRVRNVLQAGRRESSAHDRSGDRRELASSVEQAGAGPQERLISSVRRVDRIEILERGSDGRFEQVCRDGFVYNFETDHTHTYIANGFVVHNCHHCPAKSWQSVTQACPDAYHVGLSATPQRLDGQGLGAFFDALVVGPSTETLIAQGWLSPYRLFAPSRPDVSAVHRVAGDYNKAELSSTMQASAVVGDAISHYQRHTPGARALVFAWSLDASRQIAQQFRDVGVDAAHIDGETPRFEREYQMQRFATGELRVVCNVDLFGEGLDVPALDAVFLLRPTQSLGLYLQQVGRGLRRAEGKSHVAIFDHAGNWERHGLPDDPREWSLAAKEKSKAPSEACGKRCMQCFGVARPSAKVCPYCHAQFVVQSREVERVDGSLEEIARSKGSPDELNASLNRVGHIELRRLSHQCSSLADFQALAKRLQFKPQWAWLQWKLRERNTARYTGVGV